MPTFLYDVLMPTFLFDIMMPTFLFDVLMPTTFSQERDWKTANCCRLAAKDLGRAENAICEPARQNKQASGGFQKTDTKTETSVNKDQDKDNDFYRETAVSLVHFFRRITLPTSCQASSTLSTGLRLSAQTTSSRSHIF